MGKQAHNFGRQYILNILKIVNIVNILRDIIGIRDITIL